MAVNTACGYPSLGEMYASVSTAMGHMEEAAELTLSYLQMVDVKEVFDISMNSCGFYVTGASLARFACDTMLKVCYVACAVDKGEWNTSYEIATDAMGYIGSTAKALLNCEVFGFVALGAYALPAAGLAIGSEVVEGVMDIGGRIAGLADEKDVRKSGLLLVLKTVAVVCAVASIITALVSSFYVALAFGAAALLCKIAHDICSKVIPTVVIPIVPELEKKDDRATDFGKDIEMNVFVANNNNI